MFVQAAVYNLSGYPGRVSLPITCYASIPDPHGFLHFPVAHYATPCSLYIAVVMFLMDYAH